jgi:hypothetical protein
VVVGRALTSLARLFSWLLAFTALRAGSGRSHSEMWVGCIVSSIEPLATTATANDPGNRGLALERPQLDVYRLVAPQAVDQRNQEAVQDRMFAGEQSSCVRGLLSL